MDVGEEGYLIFCERDFWNSLIVYFFFFFFFFSFVFVSREILSIRKVKYVEVWVVLMVSAWPKNRGRGNTRLSAVPW